MVYLLIDASLSYHIWQTTYKDISIPKFEIASACALFKMFYVTLYLLLFCGISTSQLQKSCNNSCICENKKDLNLCICEPICNRSKWLDEPYAISLSEDENLSILRKSLASVQKLNVYNLNIYELKVNFSINNILFPFQLYDVEFNGCNISLITEDSFENMENVTHLTVKNSPNLFLDSECFNDLYNLIELNLENNSLDYLPDDVFSGLNSLQVLNLNLNNLIDLPDEIFNNLNNLKIIHIENNGIQSIHNDLFSSNTNLEMIYLNLNLIEHFDAVIIEDLKELKLLSLSLNPLNCNCHMRDLYDEHKKRKFFINGECVRPKIQLLMGMKRGDFNCKETQIKNITETRNKNIITLNCNIESKKKPNAKWEYSAKLYEKIKYIIPTLKEKLNDYVLTIEIHILDTQRVYRNYFTCVVNNSDDTLGHQVTYIPPKNNTKKSKNSSNSNKNIIAYEFKTTKDFTLKWDIKIPEDTKIFNYILSLVEMEPFEYIASLTILNDDVSGKFNLDVKDLKGSVQTTKIQNTDTSSDSNKNKKKMKEISSSLQYKGRELSFMPKLSLNTCVRENFEDTKDFEELSKNNIHFKCFYSTLANFVEAKNNVNRSDVISIISLVGCVIFIGMFTFAYKKFCATDKERSENENNADNNSNGDDNDIINSGEIISFLSNKILTTLTSKLKDNSNDDEEAMGSDYEETNTTTTTEKLSSSIKTTTITKEYHEEVHEG